MKRFWVTQTDGALEKQRELACYYGEGRTKTVGRKTHYGRDHEGGMYVTSLFMLVAELVTVSCGVVQMYMVQYLHGMYYTLGTPAEPNLTIEGQTE